MYSVVMLFWANRNVIQSPQTASHSSPLARVTMTKNSKISMLEKFNGSSYSQGQYQLRLRRGGAKNQNFPTIKLSKTTATTTVVGAHVKLMHHMTDLTPQYLATFPNPTLKSIQLVSIHQKYATNSTISVGFYVLTLINLCFYAYFSSKSSKTSHLNYKNCDKGTKFSDKWSPGGGAPPPGTPIGFGPAYSIKYFFKRPLL